MIVISTKKIIFQFKNNHLLGLTELLLEHWKCIVLISHFSFDVEDTHGVAFHWRVVEDEIEAVIEGKDTQSWVAVGEALHFVYWGKC